MKKDVYGILLAGGKGTRLWPLSTESLSKPFIRFGKRRTLIEEAIERLKTIIDSKNIIVVIDRSKQRLLRKVLKGSGKVNVFVEPFGRNTASAVGLAAIRLRPESRMVVLHADQLIKKMDNFKKTIKEGLSFIENNEETLLCVGTRPKSGSESFGYIKTSRIIKGNVFAIERFIEKPSIKKAKKFLRNKNYLWNAGIFIFKAGSILNAMRRYSPLLYKNLQYIKKRKKSIENAYSHMKNISLDYQIMEKAKNLYCIKGKFIWKDIGNWQSIGELFKKDKYGNVCFGNIEKIGVSDSVIYNTEKETIGVVGFKDAIIVNTENGMLICDKKDAEKVKKLVKG